MLGFELDCHYSAVDVWRWRPYLFATQCVWNNNLTADIRLVPEIEMILVFGFGGLADAVLIDSFEASPK